MPRCEAEGCNKEAYYNLPNETTKRFCRSHAGPDMVNVDFSKRCEYPGCITYASFSYPGIKRTRCRQHVLPGMIGSSDKLCQREGCHIIASFNLPGETKGKYCQEHAEDNMVDVKSRKCEFENCTKTPHYNMPNEKGVAIV